MFNLKFKSLKKIEQYQQYFNNPTYSIKGEATNIEELVKSDCWPVSVPDGLIVRNDDQIKVRAKSILYSYRVYNGGDNPNTSLYDYTSLDAKLLDYGCGGGQVVMAANEAGFNSIGYDVKVQWQNPNKLLTANFEKIKENAPYNFILMYDVIDHIGPKDKVNEELSKIRNLCNSDTKILIRTHPWTSRHASHSYYKLNRAWAHLFLSEDQLRQYTDQEYFLKLDRPLNSYQNMFESNGFKIDHMEIIRTPIDKFFDDPDTLSMIAKMFDGSIEWVKEVLQFEFVDYQISINVK